MPPTQCFMQIAGSGYRMRLSGLRKLFSSSEEIRTRVLDFVQQQSMTTSQLAACNRLHELEPRLARWLLMVPDRVEDDVLNLTQEFIAQMLGTFRPAVAIAAGVLQREGFIEYARGR